MSQSDGMIQAFIVVVLIVLAGVVFAQAKTIDKADDLIRGCELNLPRTETCVLIAVPESSQELPQ